MISIVIPVYNGERYIESLFRSLRAQTDGHFEAVFVDDGSRDGTLSALRERENRELFPVRVLSVRNGGVSAARNLGLSAAKGEYVCFADVDDVLSRRYIQTLAKSALSGGFDCLRFGIERLPEGASELAPIQTAPTVAPADRNDMLRAFLIDPKRFGPFGLLLKRSFLLENRLRFAEGYAYYEDYDFLARCLAYSRNLRETDACLYGYRMSEGSAMSRFGSERVTCLRLMRELVSDIRRMSIPISGEFEKWLVARLYWSVLWQACVALPSSGDLQDFIAVTRGRELLGKLTDFPVQRVSATAKLCLFSPRLYALAARAMGGEHTLINRMSAPEAFRLMASLKGVMSAGGASVAG